MSLVLATLACGGILGLFLWWSTPRIVPGTTIENYRTLRIGMTEEEVADVFGRPCDLRLRWEKERSSLDWHTPTVAFHIIVAGEKNFVTGGETIWTSPELHENEDLGDTRWARFWRPLWQVRE